MSQTGYRNATVHKPLMNLNLKTRNFVTIMDVCILTTEKAMKLIQKINFERAKWTMITYLLFKVTKVRIILRMDLDLPKKHFMEKETAE